MKAGSYNLCDLANMDQTPLPFVLEGNKSCDTKVVDEVWCDTGQSGLDKRQCIVQLTGFADGSTRLPPLIVFKGKGLCISAEGKRKWDKIVAVSFQKSAWCDENVMKQWVKEQWGNALLNSPSAGSIGKILYADVHTTQQIDSVKMLLDKNKTTLINLPGGTTSRVQPLDVAINKLFKNIVLQAFEEHLHKNLQLYTEGKLTASDKRVLTTKWVGDAWSGI